MSDGHSGRGNYIDHQWTGGTGAPFASLDPANGQVVWEGNAASLSDINSAIHSAQEAFQTWSRLSVEERIPFLKAYEKVLEESKEDLAKTISQETGKPLWESASEVQSMISKIAISIDAYKHRCPTIEHPLSQAISITRHKPHGVVAILGPFNFPGHLPNGHLIPALLAGNTVVFKPSEHTPLVAEFMIRCWEKTALPQGVINMVQGGWETGKLLSEHPDIQGLFFTGSAATGKKLSEHFAKNPGKILALEMGGNNPLIIGSIDDLQTAALLTIQSAFLTSGQRCTCARRLFVLQGETGDRFLKTFIDLTQKLTVKPYTEKPEPFMGPVISEDTALKLLKTQEDLISKGGRALVPMRHLNPKTGLLSPGIIEMTTASHKPDVEFFGPLLQVFRVLNLDEAIRQANHTVYGLSAGLLSSDRKEYEKFYQEIHAGVISWNTATTGASSAAPFGGIGWSGNYRPSAYYAADYCAFPVASMESAAMKKPIIQGLPL